MLKALIFDVDGTLADTERDGHRVACNLAFQEAGLQWHWDAALYGRLLDVTGGKERLRHYIETWHPEFRPPGGEDLEAFVARLHACKNRHFADLVRSGRIPPRPGIRPLLEEARKAGLKLAIASTAALENVHAILGACFGAGAVGWFDVIAAGDVVAQKKPAPAIYHCVLDALGLIPGECLAFEDSEHGLKAALAAGIPTIVAVNEYTRGQQFNGAALVVENLAENAQPLRIISGIGGADPSDRLTLSAVRALHAKCLRTRAVA